MSVCLCVCVHSVSGGCVLWRTLTNTTDENSQADKALRALKASNERIQPDAEGQERVTSELLMEPECEERLAQWRQREKSI